MSVCESKGSSQSLLPSPAKSWTLTAASLGHSSLASSQPPAGHIRPGTAVLQDKTKGSTQSRHPPFGSVFTAEPGVVAEETGAGPCGARAQARHVCRPVWGAGPWEARARVGRGSVEGAGPWGARAQAGVGLRRTPVRGIWEFPLVLSILSGHLLSALLSEGGKH